jgi:hypothetical protein
MAMIEIFKADRVKDLLPPLKEKEVFINELTLNKAEKSYIFNIKRTNQVLNKLEDVMFQMSFDQMEEMLKLIQAEKDFSSKKIDTSYLP